MRLKDSVPYVICDNCGCQVILNTKVCPLCDTPINHHAKRKIVEQPVELKIVGIQNATPTRKPAVNAVGLLGLQPMKPWW